VNVRRSLRLLVPCLIILNGVVLMYAWLALQPPLCRCSGEDVCGCPPAVPPSEYLLPVGMACVLIGGLALIWPRPQNPPPSR